MCGKKADDSAAPAESGHKLSSLLLRYSEYLDSDALFKIAWAKQNGVVNSEYPEEAEEIYKVLAFRGHLDGTYRYAEILLGKNPPETQLARQWLKIAAEAGHNPSKMLLQTYDWSKEAAVAYTGGESAPARHDEPPEPETRMQPIRLEGDAFADKVRKVLPSVVLITATEKKGNKCIYKRGSGFIVRGGYIVTNAHVIGENSDCIQVNFEPTLDGRTYGVYPLAVSEVYDVAVLAFSGGKQNFADRALELNTALTQYGEEVYTIGNPLGIGMSVSKGIISCPDRSSNYPSGVSSVIQTDITVNHGNSGGALCNGQNQVVGMVTFVPGNSEGGIGMCVPSVYIEKILKNI